jgi:hypothetical protein
MLLSVPGWGAPAARDFATGSKGSPTTVSVTTVSAGAAASTERSEAVDREPFMRPRPCSSAKAGMAFAKAKVVKGIQQVMDSN